MTEELKLMLTEMKQGFKEVNQRLDGMDQRFDKIDNHLDRIEKKVDGIQKQVVNNSEAITELNVKVNEQATVLATLSMRSITQEGEIRNLKQVQSL
ncbi:hypothetical protein ACFP7A_04845 [Sporolactobacillus kofuensis]|uniref:t-SNARE coiled-coil homology domain-containing protein n=1 Tax=Sporolactobacillus kofuensis TaxID=269672 RepID=A0ABW1WF42_9BACL|nr:hypothetical protein [Sporolactobacillus kofuensis]MCO7174828.1 hypothetical protein [Sporolactobacillus kofuensis]